MNHAASSAASGLMGPEPSTQTDALAAALAAKAAAQAAAADADAKRVAAAASAAAAGLKDVGFNFTSRVAFRADTAGTTVEGEEGYMPIGAPVQMVLENRTGFVLPNDAVVDGNPERDVNLNGVKVEYTNLAAYLPDFPPVSAGVDQLRAEVDTLSVAAKTVGRATIKHKTSTSFGGIIYDVINVTGGPHTVVKKYGPDVDGSGVMLRRTARDAARVLGFPAAKNADRNSAPDGGFWTTSAYGIARGLQIVDGVAYRDFQTGTSQDEAFVMMRDGTHRQAYIADG